PVIQLLSFFFFQAEDGIRDGHVTGVQTCALPISRAGSVAAARSCRRSRRSTAARGAASAPRGAAPSRGTAGRRTPPPSRPWAGRSEERRVGKECRSGWWREQ